MGDMRNRSQGFSAQGRVVEILDRAGERQTRIVLGPGTVIDVQGSAAADLHLGDTVVVEAVIDVERIRPSEGNPSGGLRPGPHTRGR